MCRLYYLLIGLFLMSSTSIFAQRVVTIEANDDPLVVTDIFPIIMGDTTATGERMDNNTIYELENGSVYATSGRLVNTPDWTLHIQAVDLEDTENKPIISRIPNDAGSFPDILRSGGDLTLLNLWIISGEKGALEQHDWGKIRILGENSRVVVEDCIIEKDRGGFLQLRADGVKMYVSNTILRNGGNRRILQGNGRGIDARNFALDTLVMRDVIVHNIQDRFFRSQGGTSPHNYVEIDNCTSFNTIGRHGHIQLGRVRTAVITNNLFVNPIMLGTSPFYTDEQTQPDNETHKVITIDTLYEDTELTIEANNIFWTEDVTSAWDAIDSVSMPGFLSDLIVEKLGEDGVADAYFSEEVMLSNVPQNITQYVIDLYNNPMAEDMFDFIVEDVLVEGTAFDSDNLFDFSSFDACYSADAQSATAATFGGAVGATASCPAIVASAKEVVADAPDFTLSPNPLTAEGIFNYSLSNAGRVQLNIYSLDGQLMTTLLDEEQLAGDHNLTLSANLPSGMYIAVLKSAQSARSLKMIVK
ncbi:MAG: T9SS type A sorting domain-containing protein [Bacteroidota bacterium]